MFTVEMSGKRIVARDMRMKRPKWPFISMQNKGNVSRERTLGAQHQQPKANSFDHVVQHGQPALRVIGSDVHRLSFAPLTHEEHANASTDPRRGGSSHRR